MYTSFYIMLQVLGMLELWTNKWCEISMEKLIFNYFSSLHYPGFHTEGWGPWNFSPPENLYSVILKLENLHDTVAVPHKLLPLRNPV